MKETTSVLILVAIGLSVVPRPASAQTPPRILVMPFENVTRESRIFWLGEAAAVLLADDLIALGADAIAREERREAFNRLQAPQTATLTDATVIRTKRRPICWLVAFIFGEGEWPTPSTH